MSDLPVTYLDPATLPFPFCPGCGHGTILERLDAAMAEVGLDPGSVVLVTDIGCAGLSDRHFVTHALHGLHGRSVTYASGIKLARPDLHVVVLMGDGGCGIGGHHLINAARRNIGVTVVVFNNLNYGMTGGEHSVSTPPGAVTATTPLGQIERPMDICGTVAVNGAGFVARTTTFHGDVTELLARALRHDGFALVDVWELCTAYYAPRNRLSRRSMETVLEELGFATGVLREEPRPEMAAAYRRQHAAVRGDPAFPARGLPVEFSSSLPAPSRWLLAGAAGRRIGSAAGALARAAVRSGLHATLRTDYPVTVRTGYSLAEVILSPEPVRFTGVDHPDVVLDLFPEGHARVAERIRALPEESVVYRTPAVPEVETLAEIRTVDPSALPGLGRRSDRWAVAVLARAVAETGVLDPGALEASVRAEDREMVRRRWPASPAP